MPYRVGVDVGGTFTDLVLIEEETGTTHKLKTPSTPKDPSVAVVRGVSQICEQVGIEPGQIRQFLHGTTVATNLVLQGGGVRVGLVTTEGFRQVLQIARSAVPGRLGSWITWPKPEPLAPLECTIEAKERISFRGEVLQPLDEDDLRFKLRQLREQNIEALTIALVNSYANSDHEWRVAEIAAEEIPDVPISVSADILPELGEYERAITTVASSYVRPKVSRYLNMLGGELAKLGIDANVRVLRSDGGLASLRMAEAAPVSLLMSGPAGGVHGAIWAAAHAGYSNLLTLDMGGTSADVALVEDGSPRMGRDTEVGDLTVRVPSVDVRTVGAGGGSIAHVPELTGALRVGPESAGADPGPVAYNRGGTEPTVTDANLVLGYLPPHLLGGAMSLDRDAAEAAVACVGEKIGVADPKRVAAGIIDIVNENMSGALRRVSVGQGYDPRDFALVAFGGAGPLHGNAVGRLMGSWPVIIPPAPGVMAAFGEATTVLKTEEGRTFIRRFSETSNDELRGALDELASAAAATLEAEGVARDDQLLNFQVDVRYTGQRFEEPVDIEASRIEDVQGDVLAGIGTAFDAMHQKLFMFSLDAEHELVNLRVTASSRPPEIVPPKLEAGTDDPSAARVEIVSLWMDGEELEGAIYDRSLLLADNIVSGPAVVVGTDSTALVLAGHHAIVDACGNLLIFPDNAE